MRDEDEDISRRRLRGGGSVARGIDGKEMGEGAEADCPQSVHRKCRKGGRRIRGFRLSVWAQVLSDGYNLHVAWKKFLASL